MPSPKKTQEMLRHTRLYRTHDVLLALIHHVQFVMRFKVANNAGGAREAAALGGIHALRAMIA